MDWGCMMETSEAQGNLSISLAEKARGAILGAAVGDALGWPQEVYSVRPSRGRSAARVVPGFRPWLRRSGGQYYPHDEQILAGEYSDDTQLILCTARTVLQGEDRWQHFIQRELPAWTLYERGAGRATRAAVAMWVKGTEPWSPELKQADLESYFGAGGNGVAMRILPHCIIGAQSEDFTPVAREIMANGICTHGHPRALVGALAYGFALWSAFRQTAMLQYGQLIDLTSRQGVPQRPPDVSNVWPDWWGAALEVTHGRYEEEWLQARNEMLRLLETCDASMEQGALSVDRDVLTRLGCFERAVSGAGTVSAAAAIFLTSRYAADPVHGLQEAAFAYGADTDTIASMTSGLLGAICRAEWLGEYSRQVQDSGYLNKISERLAMPDARTGDVNLPKPLSGSKAIEAIKTRLDHINVDDALTFPDGREARVSDVVTHAMRSKTVRATSWKLTVDDGQTLYMKKIIRNSVQERTNAPTLFDETQLDRKVQDLPTLVVRTGIKLPVRDLHAARDFYQRVLGLANVHESPTVVNVNRVIALVQAESVDNSSNGNFESQPSVFFETRSLDEVYHNIEQRGGKIVTPLADVPGRRFFRCNDLDGNILEFYERKTP